MQAGAPPVPHPRRRVRTRGADAGVSLIEVLVATALIGVVMTALTSFFTTTLRVSDREAGRQSAIRIADSAVERVRALPGSAVTTGRDQASTVAQWNGRPAAVSARLTAADLGVLAWDGNAATGSGASAALPTGPEPVRLAGVDYAQNWYVGRCWQPTTGTGGACDDTQATGDVLFYRVAVAVTWPDRRCDGRTCAYVSATLATAASADALFNANAVAAPPAVANPGNQTGQVGIAPTLTTITGSGGAPPLTWSGDGLPPGVTVASNGSVVGTPTAAGTFTVKVTATDARAKTGTAEFTWTVAPPPTAVAPAAQTTYVGVPASLTLTSTGGTGPYTWSVAAPNPAGTTGLPAGLSLTPSTGQISGTPTTQGPARTVTVTVTDRYGKTSSASFPWTVAPMKLDPVLAQATKRNRPATAVQVFRTGGSGTVTWVMTGHPVGLVIDQNGLISGTPNDTKTGIFTVTVTVTDAAGRRAATTFSWDIT